MILAAARLARIAMMSLCTTMPPSIPAVSSSCTVWCISPGHHVDSYLTPSCDRLRLRRQGIKEQMHSAGRLAQGLFNWFVMYRNWWRRRGYSTPILHRWERLLTRPVQSGRCGIPVGSCLSHGVSGKDG